MLFRIVCARTPKDWIRRALTESQRGNRISLGRWSMLTAYQRCRKRFVTNVSVIAALGGPTIALAAKASTTAIPIVFQVGVDPVRSGLVAGTQPPQAEACPERNFIERRCGTKAPRYCTSWCPQRPSWPYLSSCKSYQRRERRDRSAESSPCLGCKNTCFAAQGGARFHG